MTDDYIKILIKKLKDRANLTRYESPGRAITADYLFEAAQCIQKLARIKKK